MNTGMTGLTRCLNPIRYDQSSCLQKPIRNDAAAFGNAAASRAVPVYRKYHTLLTYQFTKADGGDDIQTTSKGTDMTPLQSKPIRKTPGQP